MSAIALQRVYVRMLFDPSFVEAVFTAPGQALSDVDVTETERTWLLACDRRLFTADPLRRRRSLKALIDEFKGSSALVVSSTRRLATLDAFFSSKVFHDSIQHRRSMALAYADYLSSLAHLDARIGAVATLEGAMAAARRGRRSLKKPPTFDAAERYVTAPGVALAKVPRGTLPVLQAIEQVLFELSLTPVAALADDGPDLRDLPQIEAVSEFLLATRGEGENVSLEELPEGLGELLELARMPIDGAALNARAQSLGADDTVVQSLLDERLLSVATG